MAAIAHDSSPGRGPTWCDACRVPLVSPPVGALGTDPEMRFTASGDAVTVFRLAVSHVYTSADGQRQEETEWFSVATFGRLAEQCNLYLQKGRQVYVEGRLRSRSWEGTDGQRRFTNEVVAQKVLFLDRAGASSSRETAIDLHLSSDYDDLDI